MTDNWQNSLVTDSPKDGFELAIKYSRTAVKFIQPDDEVRRNLRVQYAGNADSLTAAALVVATNFQTIAAANDYWRR